MGADAVRAHEAGRDLRQQRPCPRCTTSTRSTPRCSRDTSAGAGLDHFKGENLPTDHPLCAMPNVVLTPHIGGATYDTEANHSKLIADDVARVLRGEQAGPLREPRGAAMTALKGTAEEIKAELLWVAQESLRTNLVHGTAGNFSARLPDGNVVLTPSSLAYETMTLDDLVVTDLDGNVARRRAAARPRRRRCTSRA